MPPIVIDGLGVRLAQLTCDDIQLVRQWRNSPGVAGYMHHREEITVEQQERWFAALDPSRDFYFIVMYEGQKVGLSNLKHVDYVAKTGEGGLFIVPEVLRNGLLSYRASLPALDWIYEVLGLESVTANVRVENRRALRFNASIGHRVDPDKSNQESVVTIQTRETWQASRPTFVKIFGEWR